MAVTHHPRAKGMQKVRIETLWRNCYQVQSQKRSRTDKAVFGTTTLRDRTSENRKDVRLLEIEKARLKLQLKGITREYQDSADYRVSRMMVDLIIKIEKIELKIANLR